MRLNIKRIILAVLILDILVCAIIICALWMKEKPAGIPKVTALDDNTFVIREGPQSDMIKGNFWNFIKMSYIVVGNGDDYILYKIVSEVPRNDYDLNQLYDEDDGFKYYHDADGNRKSHVVIDVSTYQGNIDFDKVKKAGVDTVMIRAGLRGYGNGAIKSDPKFTDNILAAKAAGLKVGVYFFSQAINEQEGIEEARFVLELIRGYDIEGPVAIDTEYVDDSEARTYDLNNDLRTDGVVGFCETIKAAGYQPMIYANRNWFVQNLDMKRLGDYKLWVAHYVACPDFPYLYTGWQYTDKGNISGIEGNVDLNVWFD